MTTSAFAPNPPPALADESSNTSTGTTTTAIPHYILTSSPDLATAMSAWPAASRAFVGTRNLAPMVRVGTLPMRLLALDYGADFVYGPEIIDKRIIGSERIVNELLGTVDYVKNGTLNFRTIPAEKDRLVFQMGTADPDLAVQAAKLVARDVAYVDVNCGCPKHFSIQGGMGAALLETPDKLVDILTALVQHSPVPVTCKIRMLPDRPATLDLIERLVSTGISALAIHCRTRFMSPQDPGDWTFFSDVAQRFGTRLPILVNGDLFDSGDLDRAFTIPGVSGVLMARAAQANPSVFLHSRGEAPRPLDEVMQGYVRYAIKYDMIYQNTKYVLMQMYPEMKGPKGKQLAQTRGLRAIAAFFGVEAEHDALVAEREAMRLELLEKAHTTEEEVATKKRKQGEGEEGADAVLGHKDWNKDGGDETECPYIPNAPYIPTKKRKTEGELAVDVAAAADVVASESKPSTSEQ